MTTTEVGQQAKIWTDIGNTAYGVALFAFLRDELKAARKQLEEQAGVSDIKSSDDYRYWQGVIYLAKKILRQPQKFADILRQTTGKIVSLNGETSDMGIGDID